MSAESVDPVVLEELQKIAESGFPKGYEDSLEHTKRNGNP